MQCSCFATVLLHYALLKVTTVLVLFVIFGDVYQLINIYMGFHKLPLATSGVFPITLGPIYCVMLIVNDSDVIDCGHERTLLLFSLSFQST